MLKQFETWPDVVEHVRSGEALYYVPNESLGPCRMVARVRPAEEDNVRLWLRHPEYMANTYPSMIADKTFLDKLYRWEPRKAGPIPVTKDYPNATAEERRDTTTRDRERGHER